MDVRSIASPRLADRAAAPGPRPAAAWPQAPTDDGDPDLHDTDGHCPDCGAKLPLVACDPAAVVSAAGIVLLLIGLVLGLAARALWTWLAGT